MVNYALCCLRPVPAIHYLQVISSLQIAFLIEQISYWDLFSYKFHSECDLNSTSPKLRFILEFHEFL